MHSTWKPVHLHLHRVAQEEQPELCQHSGAADADALEAR